MEGIGNKVKVHGIGWIEWRIRDVRQRVITVKTRAYYVPSAKVRLFSPQTYFQENGAGSCLLKWDKCTLTNPSGEVGVFPYNLGNNLPLMLPDWLSPDSNHPTAGLTSHALMGVQYDEIITETAKLLEENNVNLSASQKELCLWHYRLCHRHYLSGWGVGWGRIGWWF